MAEKHLITPAQAGWTPCASPCNTPYYQEEQENFGGAAVLRMVLNSEKVGLNPVPSQTDLFNYAHTNNIAGEPANLWYIDPKGMHDALIHFMPPSFPSTFVNYNFPATSGTAGQADLNAANNKIVYTIDHYEVAPAVLVGGGPQWIAVVGYRTDTSGQLTDVFLDDPRPPIISGTGDPPNYQVSASTWSNTYFKPVTGGTAWQGKYAMVCDPDRPKGELLTAIEKPLADGEEIIKPELALEFSKQILEERGMLEREHIALAVQQGTPAAPQLVHVLGDTDQFYYLIRYRIEELDALVILVDARFGTFIEAIAFPRPIRFFAIAPEDIPEILRRGIPREERVEDIRDSIIDHFIQNVDLRSPGAVPGWNLARVREAVDRELSRLRQPIDLIRFRPELISVHPVMAWQPNAGSFSMLYPFYQVNILTFQLYVRATDGRIFTHFDPFFTRLGG